MQKIMIGMLITITITIFLAIEPSRVGQDPLKFGEFLKGASLFILYIST